MGHAHGCYIVCMAESLDHPIALTQSPSFQIERIRRATKDEVEKALAEHGTTMREFWVLTCTLEHAASQTQLSELLATDASDMVRLIDSLEAHGWVTRDRDPRDRRRQIISPTKKGTKMQAQLADVVTQAEDRALDATTTKQLKHLRKLSQAVMAPAEDETGTDTSTESAEAKSDAPTEASDKADSMSGSKSGSKSKSKSK